MAFTYTISAGDWAHVAPMFTILITALLVMVIDVFIPARTRGMLVWIALLGVVSAVASVILLYQQNSNPAAFFGMVTSDSLSLFASLIILVATGLSLLLAPGYIERQGIQQQGEYYALVMLASTGMLLLVSSTNLMTIFLGVELLSLPLYVLSAFAPRQKLSQESGMKYFLLSSFASGFLLYGMAMTYGATGKTGLGDIKAFLLSHPLQVTSGFGPLLLLGFGLLSVGLAFKVSAIPFHSWTPDVYEGAPTPVTAMMSAGTKTAAFVAFIRIFDQTFGSLLHDWQGIIWTIAILTILGGNIMAATQTNVKRLLAYSSIAHAGYILIGIAIGTAAGTAAAMFYLATYTVMNVGAFGVVATMESIDDVGTSLTDFQGLAQRRPWMAAAMATFLFALAGLPGTAGFIGKYMVFYAAGAGGHIELTIIGVVGSMIGFYYYLRVIWAMYFSAPIQIGTLTGEISVPQINAAGVATLTTKAVSMALSPIAVNIGFAVILTVLGTLALGIVPGPLYDLARSAAGLP